MKSVSSSVACAIVITLGVSLSRLSSAEDGSPTLGERLAESPWKLIFETYNNDNWDLAVANADGSGRRNITNSSDCHELYPQVSPDGTKVCFLVDSGSGRQTLRSVWVMDIDGQNRRKIADHARQPFWAPDSKTIAYLPQEFNKFNIADYFTKGLNFYDIETGDTRPHPNSEKLHHLYNPNFASNGKWIAATVHAGMGYGHSNLLIEADGDRIINLGDQASDELASKSKSGETREFGGCRPCISPDSHMIAWGKTDHLVCVAELDLEADEPRIGQVITRIHDNRHKIYHVDWSPDGEFLSISRGISSKGDLSKPGTHEAACEMVGIYAKDWDLFVVPSVAHPDIDLENPSPLTSHAITNDGASNKESDWFAPAK
jgi:hypothetical protein